MARRLVVAAVFCLPVGLIVLDDYGSFLRPHLPWGAGPGELRRKARPARPWARALGGEQPGNFFRVSPELYRGAQPDANGFRRLAAMGVRTIVNLRYLHSDADLLAGRGLAYEGIEVNPFKPRVDQLVRFLRIVQDPNRTPVFVHCQRGIDRTGMMCAIYRMVVCGWPKDEAIAEMQYGPFGYDAVFKNVPEFLWKVNVEDLRRRVAARP